MFPEIQYVILTPGHLDDVSHLLLNHFYPRDNITFGLGYSPESMLKLDLDHIRTCLASGLSVGAIEKCSGQLVGVVLGTRFTANSPPMLPLSKNNSEAEFQMMRVRYFKLLERMKNILKHPEVDHVLFLSRACVHQDYGRLRISTKIAQMCLLIATKQNYKMVRVSVTNPVFEKSLLRLGFVVSATLDFCSLEEGLIEPSRMDCKQLKTMTKRLSPTSNL